MKRENGKRQIELQQGSFQQCCKVKSVSIESSGCRDVHSPKMKAHHTYHSGVMSSCLIFQ